jgi:hypothetical protein
MARVRCGDGTPDSWGSRTDILIAHLLADLL